MSARVADELLSVFRDAVMIPIAFGEVFPLGYRVSAAGGDGGELIFANATVENFFEAGLRIEKPLSAISDQRNGSGPIVLANNNGVPGNADYREHSGFAGGDIKLVEIFGVLDVITGEKLVIIRTEEAREGRAVPGLRSRNQSTQAVIGGGESTLFRGWGLGLGGGRDGKQAGDEENSYGQKRGDCKCGLNMDHLMGSV